ncbi:MAG TPA: hypothetical protein VGF25_16525 [Thermoleophilaceae bacterium]
MIDLLETQVLPASSPLRVLSARELDLYGSERWGEDWLRDCWMRASGRGVYHLRDEAGRALCLSSDPEMSGDELCDRCARAASQIERLKRSLDDGLTTF